jgi:hypothetical protein
MAQVRDAIKCYWYPMRECNPIGIPECSENFCQRIGKEIPITVILISIALDDKNQAAIKAALEQTSEGRLVLDGTEFKAEILHIVDIPGE